MNLIVIWTIIITASLTVLSQKTTQKVLKVIFKPITYLKECIYKWIAPRNPFSISLKSYKKHVRRSNLAKIENPVGPSLDVPLEQAYAPLKLISSQNYENIELFTHAADHYRSIVLGGPGTGKTTLMKSLLMNIINKKCHPQLDKLIPVFIVLRKLATKKHSVEDAIVEAFKDYHFPGANKFITSALDQGRMLIILDGLDEVSLNREYVASQIREFCQHDEQRENKNRVFVTCRENSYRNEDLRDVIPTVVRVEAFANHHMRIFLKGWPLHKGRAAIKLYGMIQNDSQIRDICRNPLLLTILTGLYLDDDKFEVPKSRDSFYRYCIDELLSKRPARKEIHQVIHPDDKRKILERVCLERLETTGIDDDPEELTFDSIIQNAQKVLQKDFDERGLLKELVEINSIIKPLADDTYTCTHRTIQEYLAAREARRIRVPDEVIERFGNREDLIEVMYFYCGLIDNIPQLNSIAEKFIERGKWTEAGRCVLNMTEVIDEKYIDAMAKNLLNLIKNESKFEVYLEILSSFAQRIDKSFDIARISLADAIDFLAAADDESGASALESVLSSSPEEAMKVIPALLHHPSSRWKKSAIKLLSDIGTDEALDQLVQLLESEDKIVRSETARTLANLIKTRGEDLRARENFLPKREDQEMWPLEKYFPGSIAIPTINSLIDYDGKSNNKAINSAVQIIKTKNEEYKDILLLKKWKKLPIHLDMIQRRTQIGAVFNFLGGFFIVVLILFFIMISFLTSSKSLIIINFRPLKIYKISCDQFKKFDEKVLSIVSEIEKKFPPNASGISRLLPWNWNVEPILPGGEKEIFEILKQFSLKRFNYQNFKDLKNLFPLSTVLVSKKRSDSLQKIVQSIYKKLPNLRKDSYICSRGGPNSILFTFILAIMASASLYYLSYFRFRRKEKRKKEMIRKEEMGWKERRFKKMKRSLYSSRFNSIVYIALGYYFVINYGESIFIYSILGLIIILPNVIGFELSNINFPKNPFIDVIEDLQPVSSTIDGLEPNEDEAPKKKRRNKGLH